MVPTENTLLTRRELLPQRIALVLDYSLEYLGGAQSAFLDAAEALESFGHEVLIVAPGTHRSDWIRKWQGSVLGVKPRGTIPVVDLPYIPNNPKLRDRLIKVFDRELIDVVHVHSEFGLAHAAVSAANTLGLPVVHTVHTFFWQARLPKLIDRAAAGTLRRALTRLTGTEPADSGLAQSQVDALLRGATRAMAFRADAVVSPSQHQATALREASVREVHAVANCAQLTERPGTALTEVHEPIRLVWVGRLVPEKRILEFIEAVALSHPRRAIDVTIIGSGALMRQAKRRAQSLPVRFTGRLSRSEVQTEMRAAHVSVLTSYGFDNQPVTIVESVHARRPVLLCDTNLTEGLAGSGLYTQAPTPEAIARAIVSLTPERILAASAATETSSEDFLPSTYVARLRNIYRQVTRIETC
jgi:glycosyltransferase involved in cell wall biosynthesis